MSGEEPQLTRDPTSVPSSPSPREDPVADATLDTAALRAQNPPTRDRRALRLLGVVLALSLVAGTVAVLVLRG